MRLVRMVNKLIYLLASSSIAVLCLSGTAEGKLTISTDDNAAIREVVKNARKAIVNETPDVLLKYISVENGLRCTDTNYNFSEIKKFMSDRDSYLYIGLYSTEKYSAKCANEYSKVSDKEYFNSAGDTFTIQIDEPGWVTVYFASSTIKGHFPRAWALHKENGSWKILGGSFLIGNCTCE